MKRVVLFSVYILAFLLNSNAKEKSDPIQVTDNLYLISQAGANVSFLVTDDGVIVVDAGDKLTSGELIIKLVQSVTNKQIKYLILTHYHFDHTFGIGAFPETIKIIGHQNLAKNMQTLARSYLADQILAARETCKKLKTEIDQAKNQLPETTLAEYKSALDQLFELESVKIIKPDITFDKSMTIHLGNQAVSLLYPEACHTDGNIIVSFDNQKTLATGDLFFNHTLPFIDYPANSNTANWIKAIETLCKNDYEHVIPGHGSLTTLVDLPFQAEYLKDLRDSIQINIDQNKSWEEIKSEVKMSKYADWDFQFMLPSGIEAVYNELSKK